MSEGNLDVRTGDIRPLTSLRMVAALLVFLHHFYPFGAPESLLYAVSRQGGMGVSLFFTLSGFLIGLRYLPRFAANGLDGAYLRSFFMKRFARIYPLYFVIALLSLLLDAEKTLNFVNAVIHLALTQSYFLTLPMQLVPTAWSLSVELGFYLLTPLVLVGMARVGGKWRTRGVLSAVSVLAAWTVGLLVIGIGVRAFSIASGLSEWRGYGFIPSAGMMIEWTALGRFAEFAAGILAALVYTYTNWLDALYRGRRGTVLATGLTAFSTAATVLAFFVMHRTGATQSEHWLYLYFVVTAALTALTILSLISSTNPIADLLAWRPLVYLGHISYALYLMQMTILMDAVRLPLLSVFGENLPLWAYLPLLYLGANLIGAALYEWVEVPARRWLLSRRETPQQPPVTTPNPTVPPR